MIAYVFAGQGSQHRYEASPLFDRYPDRLRVADDIVGYPLRDLWTSRDGRLDSTEYTQPAVFVANALAHAELTERTGLRPDVLLGHSLGELNALHAGGAFDFETGVRLAHRRGELMSRLGGSGTMAALRGDQAQLLRLLDESGAGAYLAADNSPEEIVIAGTHEAVTEMCSRAERAGEGTAVPLRVSGPFHTPLMQAAADAFAEFLAEIPSHPPHIPVVANVSARPYREGQFAALLADQLVRPVRWRDSVRHLLAGGPLLFQEVGQSRSLTALIRRIAVADPARTEQ